MSMVKKILACQKNQSTCFVPKNDVHGLRKMSAISHMWRIKQLYEHEFVGGWIIHLHIHSFFKTTLWPRINFPSETEIQPHFKMLPIGKNGLSIEKRA